MINGERSAMTAQEDDVSIFDSVDAFLRFFMMLQAATGR